jgi:hypothetical protein
VMEAVAIVDIMVAVVVVNNLVSGHQSTQPTLKAKPKPKSKPKPKPSEIKYRYYLGHHPVHVWPM